MAEKQLIWVHPASYLYRLDEPTMLLETVWISHPDWGYIKRRDLWVQQEATLEQLKSQGYIEHKDSNGEEIRSCPFCGMYIESVPGFLVRQHFEECGGIGEEDWRKLEEAVVSIKREREFREKVIAEILRKKQEAEEMEKRERYERIKEEQAARQLAKDRKRRLKQETKDQLRKRDRV